MTGGVRGPAKAPQARRPLARCAVPRRASPSHLSSRAAGTWSAALGRTSGRARGGGPLRPSARPPAPRGCQLPPGAPTSPAGHNGPRPHSRSAPREVAAPPLPRPGAAGACVEEEREEAGASRDAGLTCALPPAAGGTLRGFSGCEEGMVVVALPQVGGLGVRDLRNGRPGQAETLRRKVCKRGADPRSWSTEGGSGGETVRKYACSANTALGAGGLDLPGIRSRLPLRMRPRGSRRRGSASQRAVRAESQSAGRPVEKEPISGRERRERGQWREAVV